MQNTKLSATTIESINKTLQRTLGISYDEFELLDHDEQQRLIRQYHKKRPLPKDDSCIVMIGSGENAIFMRVKKGEKVLVGSGRHSTFMEAGLTPEEERRRLEDQLDDMLYSKPVALVKKFARRIKNR